MCNNSKKIYFTLITIIIISLLLNLWMNARPDSICRILKKVVIDHDSSSVYFVTGLDHFLETSLSGEGNVVLKFNGFGELKKESDAGVPLLIYFRTVYSLYPRKVFVVAPGVVVNTGKDIFENKFNPDQVWMLNHQVKHVITLSKDAEGRIYNKVQKVLSNIPKGNVYD